MVEKIRWGLSGMSSESERPLSSAALVALAVVTFFLLVLE